MASLLSDAGHEMATAALPGFLRSLGAPAAALGAVEGVADGALSFSKLAGGLIADQPGVERRTVAAGWLCGHRPRPWRVRADGHLAVGRVGAGGVVDRQGRKGTGS